MLRENDVRAHVRQLKEMLPQHSEATIERVLREKHGVVDSALTVLLGMPPESGPSTGSSNAAPSSSSSSAKPKSSSKPKSEHHHHSSGSSSKRSAPVHIFPADFLRWPSDAQVVREAMESDSPAPTAEPQFVYQPPPQADYQADAVEAFSQPQHISAGAGGIAGGGKPQQSGWSKFKARFKSKGGKNYSQI